MPGRNHSRIADEAAEWLARLTFDSPEETGRELVDWLCRSPLHIEEFLVAKLTLTLIEGADRHGEIDVMALVREASSRAWATVVPFRDVQHGEISGTRSPPSIVPERSRKFPGACQGKLRWSVAALAAIVAVACGALVWACLTYSGTYSTALGERRTVRLLDGSFVELNTKSRIRVRLSGERRSVELLDGEALFKVAHDSARPFVVSAGTAIITAVGTEFDVYVADHSDTRVAVVEGRVQIAGDSEALDGAGGRSGHADAPSATSAHGGSTGNTGRPVMSARRHLLLAAGEQAQVSDAGMVLKSTEPDVSQAVAWRNGRLVFRGAPLAEVVREFSRYSDFRFSLIGRDLSRRRITGVFHPDDPQTLVSLFEGDSSVEVTRLTNGIVVRLR